MIEAEPRPGVAPTELVYLRDAQRRTLTATVLAVDGDQVALDRTILYPTGGGQPHDTGLIGACAVSEVRKQGDVVWHKVSAEPPALGESVEIAVDWNRRHELMRTHSAMHVLCGVIWNQYRVPVTGGNMEPLSARMDFEFDPLPEGFAAAIESAVAAEIAANRPIEVSFLPRGMALNDDELIRTKVNLIPESVSEIRVVDIVGLDTSRRGHPRGEHRRDRASAGRQDGVQRQGQQATPNRDHGPLTDES